MISAKTPAAVTSAPAPAPSSARTRAGPAFGPRDPVAVRLEPVVELALVPSDGDDQLLTADGGLQDEALAGTGVDQVEIEVPVTAPGERRVPVAAGAVRVARLRARLQPRL